jgi:hypothetical protein
VGVVVGYVLTLLSEKFRERMHEARPIETVLSVAAIASVLSDADAMLAAKSSHLGVQHRSLFLIPEVYH